MSAKEELQDPCDKENGKLFENGTIMEKPSEDTDKRITEKRVTVNEFPRSNTIDSAVVRSFFQIDKPEKNKPGRSNYCTCLKLPAVLVWTERIILIFICAVVAAAFTVPIIIYGVDADRGSDGEDNSTLIIDLDLDNCLDENAQQICQLHCM